MREGFAVYADSISLLEERPSAMRELAKVPLAHIKDDPAIFNQSALSRLGK